MGDTLQVATESRLVQLEPERVGRHIFEPVRLIDDDVLGLRQERSAHPRVLKQERVVDDDDAGVRGSLARTLQIAVHAGRPLAAPLVT